MRKTTKKLLSSALAGLFVLSSFPLMGAAEAEGNTALAFTPTLDGVKDEAYEASYSYKSSDIDFSFLYDADYIYIYADAPAGKEEACFGISMLASANPVLKDKMTEAEKADIEKALGTSCNLVSNLFGHNSAYPIRHWEVTRVMGYNTNTGYKNLGFNLGWQTGTAPSDADCKIENTSPESEFKLVKKDSGGAVLEFRVAYKGLNKGDALSVGIDTAGGTSSWLNIWMSKSFETFILGDAYKAEVSDDTSAPVTDAPTEPVTDAPTEPVTDAPTEPVTDAPTEPVTDAPVDPDPETSTIDGVKDSYYNDTNVLTNAAGTLYYAPVKTDGVPELHGYIEVPATAKSVFFHLYNEDAKFWEGSATLKIDVTAGTGAYQYIFGKDTVTNEDIYTTGGATGVTGITVKDVAVKTIDGDKVAVEFAVPSSAITSGKVYYAAFGVDADGIVDWQQVFNDGKTSTGAGTKIVLGDLVDLSTPVIPDDTSAPVTDAPVDPQPSTNIVKKGTPVLDGILDGKYLDSAVYRTLKNAKDGEAEFGWSALSLAKTVAFKKAGIVEVITNPNNPNDVKYNMLFNYGDKAGFDTDAFAKSETYFLWDDDALYVFSKVYDNKIFDFNSELANSKFDNLTDPNVPWLFDNIVHLIYPLGMNNLMKITSNAGGNVIYDQTLVGGGTPTLSNITGRCDRDTAENVRGIVYGEKDENGLYVDGYYTIEMRIPIHNNIKADFLKDGEVFDYGYWIVDGEGNGEWALIENKDINTSKEYLATFKLSGDAAVAPETSAPVTDAPTEPATDAPTAPVTDAPTAPVTDAPTEPATDAPTDPVTDAPTAPVTDAPTEPVTDAPTDTPEVSDTDEPTPDNLGDVTGDGVVNAKDLIRLMKFIAGEEVEIVGTSDINGDKTTNSKDLVALMKLIAAAE